MSRSISRNVRSASAGKTSDHAGFGPASRRTPSFNLIWNHVATGGRIGRSHDAHEQEADRVAERIVGMTPDNGRKGGAAARSDQAAAGRGSQGRPSMPGAVGPAAADGASISAGAAGAAMGPGLRDYFEPRFERDLSSVRLHFGVDAVRAAQSINAKAFTIGNDVVIGKTDLRPDADGDRRLIAHELAHVVQQDGGASRTAGLGAISPDARVIRRTAYCDESGSCWEDDPIAGQSIPLDHAPADAIRVSSATGQPLIQRTPSKADALSAPWSPSGVKAILSMTPEGQHVLAALETSQVNIMVCDEILATKVECIYYDPSGKLSAEQVRSGIINDSISYKSKVTPVATPTFSGYSNKDTSTISIAKDLSNLDAAATLRHERMHVLAASGVTGGDEEKLIEATVSSWRADMEKALGLTEAEKAGGTLPETDRSDVEREAAVDKSKHYKPTIEKHGTVPNEYLFTALVPRPINPQSYHGFAVPSGPQPTP